MKKLLHLLPRSRRIPRDAARAVKRLGSLKTQVVTAATTSDLLGLPGVRVARFAIEEENNEQYLHLFCEHEHDVSICPRCLKATQ